MGTAIHLLSPLCLHGTLYGELYFTLTFVFAFYSIHYWGFKGVFYMLTVVHSE
jgi:hypothetical protein